MIYAWTCTENKIPFQYNPNNPFNATTHRQIVLYYDVRAQSAKYVNRL